MTCHEGENIIQTIAKKNKKSEEEILRNMQSAIDAAWASNDQKCVELQKIVFPDGKPTAEQFIEKMSKYIKQQQT